MATVTAEFTGSVITAHVWAAGQEIPLVETNGTWSGKRQVDAWPMTVRMRCIAPSFTDWSLAVRRNGKKVLDEGGTTSAQITDKTWLVDDAGAALIQDSEGKVSTTLTKLMTGGDPA